MDVHPQHEVPAQFRSFPSKLRSQRALTKDERFQRLIHTCPVRPIFTSLAICGVVPVQLSRPFLPNTSLLRSSLLYCIILNLLVGYSTFETLRKTVPEIFDTKTPMHLNQRLKCMNEIISLAPIALIPVMWFECMAFTQKAFHFCKYQIKLEEITQKNLNWAPYLSLSRRTLVITYGVHTLIAAQGFITSNDLQLALFPACLASSMFLYHVVFWYCTWIVQVRVVAKRVLEHLKSSPRADSTLKIYESRRLWIDLRDILDKFSLLRWLIFCLLVFLFLMLTLSLYQVLNYRRNGEDEAAVRHGLICLIMMWAIYKVCNESHLCSSEMNGSFIRALDQLSLEVKGKEVQKTINLFYLTIIAQPSKVSLGGFVICNRPLITAVVSAAVTYIVILVQFQNVES